MVPPGEKTEPFLVTVVGVVVPDAPGDPGPVGKAVVLENKFERDALERRYGSCDIDDNGDLPNRLLCTDMAGSESDSCGEGDWGGSSSGGISGGACYSAGGRRRCRDREHERSVGEWRGDEFVVLVVSFGLESADMTSCLAAPPKTAET